MADEITDVSSGAPEAAASPEVVATPGDTGSNGQAEAITPAASSPDAQQTTLPSVDDVLESIPENDDDLTQIRDVPEALRNQRAQLRVLQQFAREAKGVVPYKDLVSRGTPEVITDRLSTFEKFFSPAVNPATQEPLRDERTGAPLYDTNPFWDDMETNQPGSVEQALRDLLYRPVKNDDGQVVSQSNGKPESMLREVFRDIGLDPDRYDDYKNIDRLLAGTSIDADELEAISAEHRDAYKQLPAKVRETLWAADEDTRNWHLARETERLQAKQKEVEAEKQAEVDRAKQQQEIQAYVSREVDQYLSQERQSGYQTIYNDLASKVTFSSDQTENELMLGLTCLLPTALIDPELRFGTEKILKSLGIELNGFDEALNAATENSRNFKQWELANLKVQAQSAQAAAFEPKQKVQTKLATIALALAGKLGAQKKARAEGNGQLLTQAAEVRPVISASSTTDQQPSILPAGVRADSAEANKILWERARQPR